MSNLPTRVSGGALRNVASAVIPHFDHAKECSTVVLVVRIDDKNIVARDFAAFLDLLDHVYGRSLPGSFDSYARRSQNHFEFADCQAGSWELIAEQALGYAGKTPPLIILWLVLKYLPSAILSISSAYNQVEQARPARANRKKIREEMEKSELSDLTPAQRAEVARLIDAVAIQEATLMPRVRRLMRKSFLEVKVRIKNSAEDF
jgi:hypothetical protein